MSVIQQFANPMNPRETVLLAHGMIKRVSIKPIKGADPTTGIKTTVWQGKKIESSHTISLLISELDSSDNLLQGGEEVWISMGDKLLKPGHQDSVSVKIDDKWETVTPGWIVNIPLKANEHNGKTYYKGSLAKMVKLGAGEAPAATQQQKQQQGAQSQGQKQKPQQNANQDVLRIYGDVTQIVGNVVTVNDHKIGEGAMVVTDEQLKDLVVGGRVAAIVDKDTGNIISGFKAYPPKAENGTQGSGGKRKSSYDPIGVETGHSINALQIILDRGFKVDDPLGVAKTLHVVTIELKKEYAQATNRTEDEVGASVGNAVLNACRRIDKKTKVDDFAAAITAEAKDVLTNLAEPLYDWIKNGAGSTDYQEPQAAKQEAAPQQNTVDAPPVDDAEDDPMDQNPAQYDFCDDIPFAPVGLQYGKSRIHAL